MRLLILLGLLLALVSPAMASTDPLIIAHRGASGERPEHTLAAYELAIAQGADFIEPDLVLTKDGVFIARHENELEDSTDVASRPEFAARKRTQTIDGRSVTGWFSEDFTLAELRTLRARERLPQLRPQNTRFDGQFMVPTLAEVIALARRESKARGRVIGIYPEIKHPGHFRSIGLAMEERLVRQLHRAGYRGPKAPVFIQCFEVAPLQRLAGLTRLPLIQLVAGQGAPADFAATGDTRSYRDLLTPAGLAAIARYAHGIGPHKSLVIPLDSQGALSTPTSLVRDAHAAGLKVHPWTFRSESFFLPAPMKAATPAERGDAQAEVRAFLAAGVDGLFADWPADAVAARATWRADARPAPVIP
jgi:glycerophosphoryl diester phosphodiesterase